MKVTCLCHTCGPTGLPGRHDVDFDPRIGPGSAFSDWINKHPGHKVDFVWHERSSRISREQHVAARLESIERAIIATAFHLRDAGLSPELRSRFRREIVDSKLLRRRLREELLLPRKLGQSWEQYLHNADVKVAYAATTTPTLTLASLAASSTLLAGRESTAVDNGASNKYLDYLIAGNYRQAAANVQAGRILTSIVGARDDTPNWPDVFDGTDSAETVATQDTFNSVCRIASDITTAATANAQNYFGPVAIAGLLGGVIPDQFVIFVSHSAQTSTNAWSATESDHAVRLTGIYATVA